MFDFTAKFVRTSATALVCSSLALGAQPVLAAVEEGVGCIFENSTYTDLNCTAADLGLSDPVVTVIDACDFPGDTATLQVLVDITTGAKTRYDLGIWFAIDGDPNGDGAYSGNCSVVNVPPTLFDTNGASVAIDNDQCGDVTNTGNLVDIQQADLGVFNLPCDDPDGDGFIDVPILVAYENSSTDNNCAVPSEAVPETKAKCSVNLNQRIPVPVPGQIIVEKVTSPADATSFGFNLTGPDSGIVGGFTSPYPFSLANGESFDTATFTGGLPAEVGGTNYSVTETPNGSYASVGVCSSSVDGTNTDPASIDLRPGEIVTCTFTNTLLIPDYEITKTVTDVDGGATLVDSAGDVVGYQITVANTGETAITGVSLSDPLLDGANGTLSRATDNPGNNDNVLDLGETWVWSGTYTVQQADIDNNGGGDGDIDNTATVASNEVQNKNAVADVPITQSPAYTIDKTVVSVDGVPGNGPAGAALEVIVYQIVVENTGNLTLTGVNVADPLVTNLSCPSGSGFAMAPGDIETCTGSYTVLQDDFNNSGNPAGTGQIQNTATASSNELADITDDAFVPLAGVPSYTISKTVTEINGIAGTGPVDTAGDVISYEIVVTNTGNVDLGTVSVADPLLGALTGPTESISPNNNLEVGETWTYTGDYTVQQPDIDANGIDANGTPDGNGFINNTATLTSSGEPQLPERTASAAVAITQSPDYTIAKSVVSVDGVLGSGPVDEANEVIVYQIVVTNTGNVTLNNVSVTDTLDASVDCASGNPIPLLAPGDDEICEATYAATQVDIDAGGTIDNTATADADELDAIQDNASVTVTQSPDYSISKTVVSVDAVLGTGPVDAAGEVIAYQIVVTNTGNQTLTNIVVSDPLAGTVTCPSGNPVSSLAPGYDETCTASYAATQDDIDAGGTIDNTATADADELDAIQDNASVTVSQLPNYSITKTVFDVDGGGAGASVDEAGDVITYLIVVTNTGNQTITGVSLVDSIIAGVDLEGPGESITPNGDLDVGETFSWSGEYTATQDDIDGNGGGDGDIDNTATVSSNEVADKQDSAEVPISQDADYTIEKTVTDVDGDGDGSSSVDEAGDIISYQIVVTNTGNQTLTGVNVADPLLADLSCPSGSDFSLAPGDAETCTGTYAVPQDDLDNNGNVGNTGYIQNTATASSNELEDIEDDANVPLSDAPAYTIHKSVTDVDGDGDGSSDVDAAGDIISYSIVVTNTGNLTLNNIAIDDSLGVTVTCPSGNPIPSLAPDADETCTTSYAATQDDIDAGGTIDNTASADADELDPIEDSASVDVLQLPAMTLVKSSGTSAITQAGQIVDYGLLVTNTGNMTLTNVTVTDPETDAAPVCVPNQPATLSVGEAMNCTANRTVTEDEFNNLNSLDNTATADSAETPPVDDSLVIPVRRPPPPPPENVPADNPLALLLLVLSILGFAWYWGPMRS